MFKIQVAAKQDTRRKTDTPSLILLVGPVINYDNTIIPFIKTFTTRARVNLASQMITSEMNYRLQRIRQMAYAVGFFHGTQHHKRLRDFCSTWNSEELGT